MVTLYAIGKCVKSSIYFVKIDGDERSCITPAIVEPKSLWKLGALQAEL